MKWADHAGRFNTRRRFDTDYGRTIIGEDAPDGGASHHPGKIHNFEILQRQIAHHITPRRARSTMSSPDKPRGSAKTSRLCSPRSGAVLLDAKTSAVWRRHA